MPNTRPPITDAATFSLALEAARAKARCDWAQYLGAGPDNIAELGGLAGQAAGLKLYLDQTYGPLRLDDMGLWMAHFAAWPRGRPVVAHAESRTLAAVILVAAFYDRPVHLAHVSLREEILLIRKAKERGLKVTCEVAPHHLFLSQEDVPSIGPGRSEVRPRLATAADREALWQNMEVIDCSPPTTPRTLREKDSPNPPRFPRPGDRPAAATGSRKGCLTLTNWSTACTQTPATSSAYPNSPRPGSKWIRMSVGRSAPPADIPAVPGPLSKAGRCAADCTAWSCAAGKRSKMERYL
jgi:dihydroorotase-like cyclic amidohydrolase